MRHCIIAEGQTFKLECWGGGLSFALTHKPAKLSVFFQGDDAANFGVEFDLAETNFPTWPTDEICGHLWFDHDYASVAQPMEA